MESAARAGALHHRSAAEQIEYWADLGRRVARVLDPESLLDLAAERLGNARQAGGNRVVACRKEASSKPPALQFGQALTLINAGHDDAVVPHLVQLGKEILPLNRLHCTSIDITARHGKTTRHWIVVVNVYRRDVTFWSRRTGVLKFAF